MTENKKKRGGEGRNQGRKAHFPGVDKNDQSRLSVPREIHDVSKELLVHLWTIGMLTETSNPQELVESMSSTQESPAQDSQIIHFENIDIPATMGIKEADTASYSYLDLYNYLRKDNSNKNNLVFAARVTGDSMTGAGIFPGDLLIIEQTIEPTNRDIVVVRVDDSITVKRCFFEGDDVTFSPESDNSIHKKETFPRDQCDFIGVVRQVIHSTKNWF